MEDMQGYRLLVAGDRIQATDQYYEERLRDWVRVPNSMVGGTLTPFTVAVRYRRATA